MIALKSHDAIMVCVALDEAIVDIKKAKRAAKKSTIPDERYYHGYEEGIQKALTLVKERFEV